MALYQYSLRSGSYRQGWPSDFAMEPLGVYKDKEQQQAQQLVETAQKGIPPAQLTPGYLGNLSQAITATTAAAQPKQGGTTYSLNPSVSPFSFAPAATAQPKQQPKKKSGGGLFGAIKSIGSDVLDSGVGKAAVHVGKDLLSGQALLKDLGVNTGGLPSPLREAIDVGASPLTLGTALVTGGGSLAAREALGEGLRAAAPKIAGSVLRRYGQEAGAGVIGQLAGEKAVSALPNGTPGIVKAGVGLGVGALAGGGAFKALEHPGQTAEAAGRGLARVQGRATPAIGMGIEDVTQNPARVGRETTVQSSRNPQQQYAFRYRIVDLSDPVVSHDEQSFAVNPNYEQSVQPRNRGTAINRTIIEQQAKHLDPAKLLAETGDLQNGVPIMGPDGIIESGNGRTMAARRALREHPEKWQAYESDLRSRLSDYGLTDKSLEGVQHPFLVRERVTDAPDRQAFADEANQSSTARMGVAETASADANKVNDELLNNLDIPETATLDDVLSSGKPDVARFVRHFMDSLSDNERGAMMDAKGNLSSEGLRRLKAAFFAKTYQGPAGSRLLENFFESADPSVRNVRNAMEQSLPAVARLEAGIRAGRIGQQYSIADDVAAAADAFRRLKSGTLKFKSVDDYLAQSPMFGDQLQLSPLSRDILQFMGEHNRAPKQLRETLRGYVDEIEKLPPPGQAGMFGEVAGPTDARSAWEVETGRVVPEPPEGASAPERTASSTSATLPSESIPTSTSAGQAGVPASPNVVSNSVSDIPNSTRQPSSANGTEVADTSVGSNATGGSVPPAPPIHPVEGVQPTERPAGPPVQPQSGGLTEEAKTLLARVDAGGVPGTVTRNLERIARENGVEVTGQMTPNDVIDALRAKQAPAAPMGGRGYDVLNDNGTTSRVGPRPAEARTGILDVGQGPRGADAEMGGPKPGEEEAAVPPGPPPQEPPGPTEPGPGNPQRGLGETGQPVDLLRGKDRQAAIDLAAQQESGLTGRAREAVGKGRDPRTQAVRMEKNRTDQIVTELPASQAERMKADADAVGLNVVPDGNQWVLEGFSERVPIQDVVEQTTDAGKRVYGELDEDQQAVIDEIQRVNEDWNKTVEAHGGKVPKRETPSGNFWSRRVVGREVEGGVIPKNKLQGTSRRLGGASFKARTEESVAGGAEKGIVYDDPWKSLAAGWQNKARVAQDNYLKGMVKPLAVKEARPGFGYATLPGHPALSVNKVIGTTSEGKPIRTPRPMAFENDVASQLKDIFEGNDAVKARPIQAANVLLTPVRTTLDMSWSLQQGLAALEKNLVRTISQGLKTIRSALGDPQAYYDVIRSQEDRGAQLLADAGIDSRSALDWLQSHGLHYTSEGVTDEFQFPSYLEKVPVVGKVAKFSNETFARSLNADRFSLANDALERAIKSGKTGQALSDAVEGAMKSVNRMTGWTNSNPSSVERIALFAPKFFRSNVGQIVAAVRKGDLEGQLAREHLGRLTAIAVGTTVAVNKARGYDTSFDPRSPNFMRIRNLGGQDISPFGTFATIIRGAAQATQNPVEAAKYFARAKSSPVLSTLWSLLTGTNFEGQEFKPFSGPKGALTAAADIGKESLPFTAQSLISEGPVGAGVSFLGAQSSPVTPAEKRNFKRDEVSQKLFGKDYNDLPQATQKAQVNQDPGVQKLVRAAQNNALTKDNDFGKSTQINLDYQARMSAAADALEAGQEPNGAPFNGVDYRHAYQDASMARLNQLKGAGVDTSGGDKVVAGWYALYDQAQMPDGNTDYDKLDQLQADYIAAHPDVDARLAKTVGSNDDPTLQALRRAQAQAKQYYAIPKYLGMTSEQSDRADAVLKLASGYAGPTALGLEKLVKAGKITDADRTLAFRAQNVGTNPERKKFLADNPEFAVFYEGLDEGQNVVAATSGGSGGGGGGASRLYSYDLGSARKQAASSSTTTKKRATAVSGARLGQ